MTKYNVLLCLTGSVACIKAEELVRLLMREENEIEVKVITTENAKHFIDLSTFPGHIIDDKEEWTAWSKRGDPVLHIDLRKWADLLLIAPLDANTMAKICHGVCDNLITCVVRAWDLKKPLLFAPAMNTHMWDHPLTAEQIMKLERWGYRYIPVVSKTLMCGDTGKGAMANVATIVAAVLAEKYNNKYIFYYLWTKICYLFAVICRLIGVILFFLLITVISIHMDGSVHFNGILIYGVYLVLVFLIAVFCQGFRPVGTLTPWV